MAFLSKLKEKRATSKEAKEQRRAEEAELRATEERERQERKRRTLAQREAVLDILRNDRVPDLDWSRFPQFKLAKNERMLYVFSDVEYIEQRTKRETRGKSAGTSVRVAKGVSIRAGKSAGQVVESDVRTSRGHGTLGISTKHLFFVGDERSFRIRMDKVVSVRTAGADAIEVVRDRASGHPEFYRVGTGNAEFGAELIGLVPSVDLGRGAPEMEEVDHSLYLPSDTGDALWD